MHSDSFRMRISVAAVLVGLLPAWMVLAPLDIRRAPEVWQVFVRSNAFAVPLVQLVFILLAMGGELFSDPRGARTALHIQACLGTLVCARELCVVPTRKRTFFCEYRYFQTDYCRFVFAGAHPHFASGGRPIDASDMVIHRRRHIDMDAFMGDLYFPLLPARRGMGDPHAGRE